MSDSQDASLAQYVLDVIRALQEDRLKVRKEDGAFVAEMMAAPRGLLGAVDTSKLSQGAKTFARMSGMALKFMSMPESGFAPPPKTEPAVDIATSQIELFRLYSVLFTALTGTGIASVKDEEEIRNRMLARGQDRFDQFMNEVNSAADALGEFYKRNSAALFKHAKSLGGVKLVTGGQRAFLTSALSGVRTTALYADTQLIPDPIFPFFGGELHLNALHLQMANTLFYILALKPLVDAALPVPPVFVFPSFEMELESGDAITMQGMSDLVVRTIAPVCEGTISSLDELREYVHKHESRFIDAVMAARLFVPPGCSPGLQMTGADGVKRYLEELDGRRDAAVLAQMKTMPSGFLILLGIMERLRPQYHLYENSTELDAQPLLSQEVHWHYYEKCANATAQSLVRQNILSEQSFQTLRALQDDSLGWLATLPIEGLVELNKNQEHKWFRKELKDYTAQLVSAGPADLNHVVREVNHALAELVQRQQKALKDIENKYAPKKAAAVFGGGAMVAAGAAAVMLPFLSPALGIAAPALAAIVGYGKEKAGELVEKKQATKTMLGMLAIARP
ncbi:hypothetical protein [Herbaspirillum sp.]|uniref:hypothetical protein n=1 Tax=Herbaspirillum sp. TaxID=1890675 RepID=UPI0031DD52EC